MTMRINNHEKIKEYSDDQNHSDIVLNFYSDKTEQPVQVKLVKISSPIKNKHRNNLFINQCGDCPA